MVHLTPDERADAAKKIQSIMTVTADTPGSNEEIYSSKKNIKFSISDLKLPPEPFFGSTVITEFNQRGINTLSALLALKEIEAKHHLGYSGHRLNRLKKQLKDLGGLGFGMTSEELLNLEKHPPEALLRAYPDIWVQHLKDRAEQDKAPEAHAAPASATAIRHELYDSPADVNNVNIWPGSVYRFPSSEDARHFANAAYTVFKDAGGIKVKNNTYISHLGFQEKPLGNEYLVHVSDAALSVLSQPEELSKLRTAISPAKESCMAI